MLSIFLLAAWPGQPAPSGEAPPARPRVFKDKDEAPRPPASYWWMAPLGRPAVPQVADSGWVRSPVDAFILEELESRGLSPAPPSEKLALLRRASFDLLGLPPSPEEAEAFLADDSPGAYERLIERLLDSPRYGER